MSKQGVITSYRLIIGKIQTGSNPTKQELLAYLFDHGFEISERTLERYFSDLRNEFRIEVVYSEHTKGYSIDKKLSEDIDSLMRFLEMAITTGIVKESLKESKQTLDYIAFDSQGNLKGIELLENLLFAVKKRRKIGFTYARFDLDVPKEYTLKPHLLKEYQNRWYVVGSLSDKDEFRTFGIDRIAHLKVMEEVFEPLLDPRTLFENTIGLTYSLQPVQEVVLSFTPLQGRYIDTLPLHHSQQVLVNDDTEYRISLRVTPNFELIQKILMYGSAVEVIKPESLKNDIKKSLKEALKKY